MLIINKKDTKNRQNKCCQTKSRNTREKLTQKNMEMGTHESNSLKENFFKLGI